MTEGMLILGCIQEIHRYHLMVSLPGKTSGRVPITSISRQYSDALEKQDNVMKLVQFQ
jgi:ribosomal protein S1